MPGAVITREYKGRTILVHVLPKSFEHEGHLRPIAAVLDWRKQRRMWKQLLTEQNVEIAFRN